jgi:hypothetical protein
MRKIGSFAIVALFTLFSLAYITPAFADDAILSWDANTEPDLAGYKVYYRTASGNYGTPIDVGNQTTYTISGLGSGTYYFAARAYNTSGNESDFSNEVSKTFKPGVLVVSPSTGLSASGDADNPFSPSSKSYTLTNTGGTTINYTISKGQSWLSLSKTSGSLAPGASTSVTVSINSNANSLAASTYSDTVSFTNTTNGDGNASRSVGLTVNAPGVLVVSPSTGLSASGDADRSFSPSSKSYTLTNTGGTTINYTISKGQSWVSLSKTSGSLAPGEGTSVIVSINSNANSLAASTYSDTVSFTNTTNGDGNTSRSASISVAVPGSASTITLTHSADTFINLNPNNYSQETLLNTFTWPTDQIANAILMKWDLSAIPGGLTIHSATLNLYLQGYIGNGGDTIYDISVHKIINKDPIIAQASGFTYDGSNPWTANNCCLNGIPLAQADIAAAEDAKSVDKTNGFKTWTVTQMVQEWFINPSTNFGMLINSDPLAAAGSNRTFSSSEHPQASQRPDLHITYSTGNGIPNQPTGLTLQLR